MSYKPYKTKSKAKKIVFVGFLFSMIFSQFFPAFGYLLPPQYILEFMLKKQGKNLGLEIIQEVQFFDEDFPDGKRQINETVYLRKPWKFRVDGKYSDSNQIWVNDGTRFVIITDGFLTEEGKLNHSLLRELFTADSSKKLMTRMAKAGIDSSIISLGRKGENLIYIIGSKEGDLSIPQLWVMKDTFRPVRLLVNEKINGKDMILDARFEEFGRNGPSWYPGLIEIYYDNVLLAAQRVLKANPRSKLSEKLFDLKEIKKQYPRAKKVQRGMVISSSRIRESLDLLKKKF